MVPAWMSRTLNAALHGAAGLVFCTVSVAGQIAWNNPGGGSFHDPANWATNSVPTVNDTAVFDLPSQYTVGFEQDAATRGLRVGSGQVTFDLQGHTYALGQPDDSAENRAIIADEPGQDASLTIQNGTVSLPDLPASFEWLVGEAPGAHGSLIIAADAVITSAWEYLLRIAPPDGGSASLRIEDGGQVGGMFPFVSIGPSGDATVRTGGEIHAADLLVEGALHVQEAGSASAAFSLLVDGEVEVSGPGAQLTAAGGAQGSGSIHVMGGGRFECLEYPSNVSQLTVAGNGSTSTIDIVESGELSVVGGGELELLSASTADSVAASGADSRIVAGDLVINHALSAIDGGIVSGGCIVLGPGAHAVAASVVGAADECTGGLIVHGDLGLEADAAMSVLGAYMQSGWPLFLAGEMIESAATAIDVQGAATLGGWVLVDPPAIGAAAPSMGEAFDLITAASIEGQFEELDAPAGWMLQYCPDHVRLSVGMSADLDCSGATNAADLATLLGHWGECTGCAFDLDQDGTVGPADLGYLLSVWSMALR